MKLGQIGYWLWHQHQHGGKGVAIFQSMACSGLHRPEFLLVLRSWRNLSLFVAAFWRGCACHPNRSYLCRRVAVWITGKIFVLFIFNCARFDLEFYIFFPSALFLTYNLFFKCISSLFLDRYV